MFDLIILISFIDSIPFIIFILLCSLSVISLIYYISLKFEQYSLNKKIYLQGNIILENDNKFIAKNSIQLMQNFISTIEEIYTLLSNLPQSRIHHSVENPDSKLTPIFFDVLYKNIELTRKNELQQTVIQLIPKFNISFNTLLNVLREFVEKNPDKQLPSSIEEKIHFIIGSFEKELLIEIEKLNKLEYLETKALEGSLEERLDFEIDYIKTHINNEQIILGTKKIQPR